MVDHCACHWALTNTEAAIWNVFWKQLCSKNLQNAWKIHYARVVFSDIALWMIALMHHRLRSLLQISANFDKSKKPVEMQWELLGCVYQLSEAATEGAL